MTDHSHNVVECSVPAGLTLTEARRARRIERQAHHTPFIASVIARLLSR